MLENEGFMGAKSEKKGGFYPAHRYSNVLEVLRSFFGSDSFDFLLMPKLCIQLVTSPVVYYQRPQHGKRACVYNCHKLITFNSHSNLQCLSDWVRREVRILGGPSLNFSPQNWAANIKPRSRILSIYRPPKFGALEVIS